MIPIYASTLDRRDRAWRRRRAARGWGLSRAATMTAGGLATLALAFAEHLL
jgi:hypothetical protein